MQTAIKLWLLFTLIAVVCSQPLPQDGGSHVPGKYGADPSTPAVDVDVPGSCSFDSEKKRRSLSDELIVARTDVYGQNAPEVPTTPEDDLPYCDEVDDEEGGDEDEDDCEDEEDKEEDKEDGEDKEDDKEDNTKEGDNEDEKDEDEKDEDEKKDGKEEEEDAEDNEDDEGEDDCEDEDENEDENGGGKGGYN